MTAMDIEILLCDVLHRIAPDIEIQTIDRSGDLRDEFDIDSMDFLNLVTALSKRSNITIPESDYTRMSSFNAVLTYLAEKAPSSQA